MSSRESNSRLLMEMVDGVDEEKAEGLIDPATYTKYLGATNPITEEGSPNADLNRNTATAQQFASQYSLPQQDHWGATPLIRNQWLMSNNASFVDLARDKAVAVAVSATSSAGGKASVNKIFDQSRPRNASSSQFKLKLNYHDNASSKKQISTICSMQLNKWGILPAIEGTPGLLIAILLNLFLSTSFGLAMFPSEWIFPETVPRAIGVQMFLFSTMISQIVLTSLSSFPGAVGMMMVENIPFMQVICRIAVQNQGQGQGTFATVLVTFALSSIVVGAVFYALGAYQLGNAIYYFPKHIIVGCIGGIGVFIFQTGLEVATNQPWTWNADVVPRYAQSSVWPLLLAAVSLELFLRFLQSTFKSLSLLPPFYFIAIPPIFYFVLLISGTPAEYAHANGWFFDRGPSVAEPLLMWQLMDPRLVHWNAVGESIPTIIALTIFSLMHVPINIPSLSMSTGKQADMNKELIAHGWSNFVSGIFGGLQNYLCYSNSLLYFKCNGSGRASGYLLAISSAVFFYFGPSLVYYIPRCMAGCLLLHVGVDLTKEGVWDSRLTLDRFEYVSVLGITLVMTLYGLEAGLALGVVCAALTFTLQASSHLAPIRGTMRGSTVRSSIWRSKAAQEVLDHCSRTIFIVQLQGQLFFGNAAVLAAEVEKILSESEQGDISFLILDFTLVFAIDSSAAEVIASLFDICHRHGVKLCYSRPSQQGFPCAVDLSERLAVLGAGHGSDLMTDEGMSMKADSLLDTTALLSQAAAAGRSGYGSMGELGKHLHRPQSQSHAGELMHLADSLDEALAWCEESLLRSFGANTGAPTQRQPRDSDSDPSNGDSPLNDYGSKPLAFRQMYALRPEDVSEQSVDRLLFLFKQRHVDKGEVLWRQGDKSDSAVVLVSGRLLSRLEEEAGTTECIQVGHLVGEYGLLNSHRRLGTLVATERSEIYELTRERYEIMANQEPELVVALAKICMGYLHHRIMHVSNRIWESRCLPV